MRLIFTALFFIISTTARAATIKDACTMRLDMPLSNSVFWYSYSGGTGTKPVLCATAAPVAPKSAGFIVTFPNRPSMVFDSRSEAIAWTELQPQ